MDRAPNLAKQRSCSGMINLFGSGRRSVRLCRHYEEGEVEVLNPRQSVTKRQSLWSKLKRGKRKLFNMTSSGFTRAAYDPLSYAQNFDQGSACFDPDNLSRSFSARFAGPSNMFRRFA